MQYPPVSASRSYVHRAFFDQHNLILLGGAMVLALAFASFVPALVGLCAEALFLAVGPRLAAFREWVDRQDGAERKLRVQRSLRGEVAKLGPSYAPRFETLSLLLDEIVARVRALRALSFEELETVQSQFEQLLRSSLELMHMHRSVSSASAEIPALELAQEVARLDRAFTLERDLELRMGLRQQSLAAQKRLSQREELEKTRGRLELDLSTIEKSVGYLRSRTTELVGTGQMLNEVRALLSEVAPSSRREGSLHDALGAVTGLEAARAARSA